VSRGYVDILARRPVPMCCKPSLQLLRCKRLLQPLTPGMLSRTPRAVHRLSMLRSSSPHLLQGKIGVADHRHVPLLVPMVPVLQGRRQVSPGERALTDALSPTRSHTTVIASCWAGGFRFTASSNP